MDHEELKGKEFAILMFEEVKGEEDRVHLLRGVLHLDNDQLFLYFDSDRQPFPIEEEWLKRIRPTPESFREMFSDAELYFPLTVGPLPEDADESQYTKTGLNLSE